MNRKMNVIKQDCDVLIVGSGLSGLRAALTASAYPVKVMLIDSLSGPSGSSFVNPNKKLGMQLLKTDREKEHFVQRAIEIASPGEIDPRLVKIMAEESEKRFVELEKAGALFKTQDNSICRYPGCFDPNYNTAVIIENLHQLYKKLYNMIKSRVNIVQGWMLIKLLKDPIESRICGAVFVDKDFTELLFIRSKSVVMAAGGCTGLFLWNISPEKPSFGIGILKDVGAKLCNENFVQFMWVEKRSKSFFSFEKLESLQIITNRKEIKVPNKLLSLLKERLTHCPIGYNLKDFEIDKFLLNHLTNEGVKIKIRDRIVHITPSAQAHNGGASINEMAMTSVYGLFACGEIASGMHGANRIGGAMVLATQVFGHRAGKYSCLWAKDNNFLSDKLFTQLINDFKTIIPCLRNEDFVGIFSKSLNVKVIKSLLLGKTEDLYGLMKIFDAQMDSGKGFILKLKLSSLKTIVFKKSLFNKERRVACFR